MARTAPDLSQPFPSLEKPWTRSGGHLSTVRAGHMKYRKERGNVGSGEALQRARESGSGAIISVWLYPDAYAPGSENQTMYT
jgi:hypothetical protein